MNDKKEAIKLILVKMDNCLHYLMRNIENYEFITFYQNMNDINYHLKELLAELNRKEADTQ